MCRSSSVEVEVGQVVFRLDTLGMYDGQGMMSGCHSTKSYANAIWDLYGIDVYLQVIQRCTPEIFQSINRVFTYWRRDSGPYVGSSLFAKLLRQQNSRTCMIWMCK